MGAAYATRMAHAMAVTPGQGYLSRNAAVSLHPVGTPATLRVRSWKESRMNCQIEYVSSDSDFGMPCGKPAVGRCSDCGSATCSDCQLECCGDAFCELCYDYHVTHSCLRKPVQNEREPLPTSLRPTSDKAS